jgi:hypothetical protein
MRVTHFGGDTGFSIRDFGETYKVLCFNIMGRPEKAAVSSARAKRALNRSIKKSTPGAMWSAKRSHH